jgi:tetraacyldisaccharide 4'-kinase
VIDLPPARRWALPLTPLYRLALAARELGLRTGFQTVRRLQWPVVSIGNLSSGGAGKTPLTIALAQALTQRDFRVDVLSRGYGRTSRHTARVDVNGIAEDFGDEPIEIARAASVPVYVAAQRYEAGVLAERDVKRKPTGIHLLDDGFQHRQLHRDVDILLLNSGDLRDKLLPAGNLREPLRAMHRASCIAIPAEEDALEDELRRRGWQGKIWRVRRRVEVPRVDGPVIAFCGIARPEQFFQGLKNAGLQLAERIAFRDHHRYTQADIERLHAAARRANAATLMTTEKDRVRLGKQADSFPLKTAALRMEIENADAAIQWLLTAIRSSVRSAGK